MSELGWGLQITALGMGLVFGLLALLWGLLVLALRLDRPQDEALAAGDLAAGSAVAEPAVDAADAADAADSAGSEAAGSEAADIATDEPAIEPALVAAITVAVLTHRALRRQEAAPAMRTHWPGSLLHASRWVASGRLRQNRTFRRGR